MISLVYFISIIIIAYGAGKSILSLFLGEFEYFAEDIVFSLGLGLALLAYFVFALGSFGLLYKNYILILCFVFAIFSIYPAYIASLRLRSWNIVIYFKTKGIFEKFLIGIFLAIAFSCLLGALSPPAGNDALAYHLYHPRVFIENHKIGYLPFTRESMWPYLTEMLFTLGLILRNGPLANLFHYLFGIISAMAVFIFVRRFFSEKAALLAAVLFYSAPGIFMQSTHAYIDLAQCFYSFLAFYAMMLFFQKNEFKLLILSAVFTGLGLSVKVLGGITLIALLTILVINSIERRLLFKLSSKRILIFLIFSFLVSCTWYIRSYIVLKNPVYPFLHNIFGIGWQTDVDMGVGVRRDLIGFLRLPWDIVMRFESFGGEQIGVIFLAFLPCLFFINLKNNFSRYMLLFLFLYSIIWFYIDPNIRFAFVNFSIVYVLISIGIYSIKEKWLLGYAQLLLVIMLLFNLSLSFYYNRDSFKLAVGLISPDEYLTLNERTYPVAKFINQNLPSDSVIVIANEPRFFYIKRKVISYELWLSASMMDIAGYINKMHQNNTPVYLLLRSDTAYNELKLLVKAKSPVFSIERRFDRDLFVTYSLFCL